MRLLQLQALSWQVALYSWCSLPSLAGSSCPRHGRFDGSLPLAFRSDRVHGDSGQSGLQMSQVCSEEESHLPVDRDHGRSLQYVLHGDIMRVGNWTCTDNCKPPHPDEVTTIEKW